MSDSWNPGWVVLEACHENSASLTSPSSWCFLLLGTVVNLERVRSLAELRIWERRSDSYPRRHLAHNDNSQLLVSAMLSPPSTPRLTLHPHTHWLNVDLAFINIKKTQAGQQLIPRERGIPRESLWRLCQWERCEVPRETQEHQNVRTVP